MDERSKVSIANVGFALATLLTSVAVWWQAGHLRPSPFDPMGPGAFPKLVSIILGGLSLLLIGRVLLGRDVGASDTSLIAGLNDENQTHEQRPLLSLGVLLTTTAYTAALTVTEVGFVWSTIAFVAVTGFIMSDRRPRDVVIAVAIAISVSASLSYLFTHVLVAGLP